MPFGSSQWMYSSGFYPTVIDQSLRFDGTAYLSRTPSVAGDRKTWTMSMWFKRGNIGSTNVLFDTRAAVNATQLTACYINSSNFLVFGNGANDFRLTTQVFRDVSAWYHLVVVFDSTQATALDRIKIYINGEQITSFSDTNNPSLNTDYGWNQTSAHNIGSTTTPGAFWDGYLADTYLVDGTALDPTSFGEFKNGVWIPKRYTGSYGTNGFHLEYDGNANDSSGTGNNWTATNIASTDYMLDSPTNNFCTLNVISPVTTTALSEGNLLAETISLNVSYYVQSTFEMGSGKWYFETNPLGNVVDGSSRIGLSKNSGTASSDIAIYHGNGQYEIEGVTITGKATYTAGDVIGCAFDPSDNTIEFFKNNTSQGQVSISSSNWQAHARLFSSLASVDNKETVFNFGQDSSFAGNKTPQGNSDANGIGDFYYAPPAGFLALCTANLPEPSISPLYGASPQDHFDSVIYTGSSSSQTIANTNAFQPDLVWAKSRSDALVHVLVDSIRGGDLFLSSNNALGDSTSVGLASFVSNGVTWVGGASGVNDTGKTYVNWNWKASNATAVSNTSGSITSQVSANTTAGFSIVSYTGTGANATVGHGLDSAPDMVIVKRRSAVGAWTVYHSANTSAPATDYLELNTTNATADNAVVWNDTEPTSSVFSIGTANALNANTATFIAYCFNSVEGYSKFGSYTGNGSADGPFVYTGFRPAWVMVKRTDSADDWHIYDSVRDAFNPEVSMLSANLSDAENVYGTARMDFLSNGIKMRANASTFNASGGTYIYMAFAENPFKYSVAR